MKAIELIYLNANFAKWHPCKRAFFGIWLHWWKTSSCWLNWTNTNRKHYWTANTPNNYKCWIFFCLPNDDNSTFEFKSKQRHEWKYGSITNDGKIIIPIVQKTVKYHNESVSACGGPLYFNALMVPMGDHFPIELGFYITIPKAQGHTIHKLIASLSEHPCPFLRFCYEQMFILLFCITRRNNLWLLLQMRNRNTLQNISKLKKDNYTTYYFEGYPSESNHIISYWNPKLAAKAAGFITEAWFSLVSSLSVFPTVQVVNFIFRVQVGIKSSWFYYWGKYLLKLFFNIFMYDDIEHKHIICLLK